MRLRHVAADERFLEGKLDGALEGHRGGHCYHCAWGLLVGLLTNYGTEEQKDVPGFAVKGHPIASWTVKMVFVFLWLTR